MSMVSERTKMPLGLIITLATIVAVCLVAWGTIRSEVTAHASEIARLEDNLNDARQTIRGLQNDLMAQIMLLRQDVSEIKGEMKNRR